MAIKKSELYSSLWESCDKLRGTGGMDASQYKDYVLTMLFVKYVSDKYAGNPMSLIEIPTGASFEDMVALKGQPDIGDRINKEILRPLFASNGLEGSLEIVDFNDDEKLGSGKEKVDLLSKLIAIFENPALNFKNNRAEDDDVLGDAYEFLMRHFATESGKSKGQFYTPAEVSRILSKVIDVDKADKPSYTAYDPTCGSGSLLLKVAGEAPNGLTLYGQEKDVATKGLAVMNMWLHGYPEASIAGKNTISSPQFTEGGKLKRFDFVVANPPFSVKNWDNGIVPLDDEYNRFRGFGVPPDKNGDYAFLLHILASIKSTGQGAVILPQPVLYRGNAEAEIRKNIIERKWIKGIIGLPANLFYGTPISACIIVIDKKGSENRDGIFFVDATKGYIKDGNKNRLRERDIQKIVETFNTQNEVNRYSRYVSLDEIAQNGFNLNIARYVSTRKKEDVQDLYGHLVGGIPFSDVSDLEKYWEECPSLKNQLFEELGTGYYDLKIGKNEISNTISENDDWLSYSSRLLDLLDNWKVKINNSLEEINEKTHLNSLIIELSELLLEFFDNEVLINKFSVYQHFLNYWNDFMKDDIYFVIEGGWNAAPQRILVENKKGKITDKGWKSDLLPKELVIAKYLIEEKNKYEELTIRLTTVQNDISSIYEDYCCEGGILEGALTDKGSITKTSITNFINELDFDLESNSIRKEAENLKTLFVEETNLKKVVKKEFENLDRLTLEKFEQLRQSEVKNLVVNDKWFKSIQNLLKSELKSTRFSLSKRIIELYERYHNTLDEIDNSYKEKEEIVIKNFNQLKLLELNSDNLEKDLVETEYGLIPKDWEVKPLPDVFDFIHGKAHEQDITEDGEFKVVNSKFISTEGGVVKFSSINRCPAKKDDILTVLSDLPNGRALAKTFLVGEDDAYAVNQRICIWRSKKGAPVYLNYIMNRHPYFMKFDDGVSQTHILNHHIEKCPVPLPKNPSEQVEIGTILLDIDEQINLLEEKLKKLNNIRSGLRYQLLNGIRRVK